jgi:hypothetical protein
MQDDLLAPQADIDWAISQLPILDARMTAWRQGCSHTVVEDLDSQPGQKFIRVRNVKPMPLIINAEVGAIINSIRSSLDVLAVTLAERHGAVAPKDIYFPICRSQGQFFAKENGGHKKIHRLSNADKMVIEHLQPYNTGNNTLSALHNLDIARKHRRLVAIFGYAEPLAITAYGDPPRMRFKPWVRIENDAVLATGDATATHHEIQLLLDISFDETEFLGRSPVLPTLFEFANLAESIIKLFDV